MSDRSPFSVSCHNCISSNELLSGIPSEDVSSGLMKTEIKANENGENLTVLVVPSPPKNLLKELKVLREDGSCVLDDQLNESSIPAPFSSNLNWSNPPKQESIVVMETVVNGIRQHRLVTRDGARCSAFVPGRKLHVVREHLFAAHHLSKTEKCYVCGKHFPFRPGKQGYQCVLCGLKSHKSCHTLVENSCTNAADNKIELQDTVDGIGHVSDSDSHESEN